LNRNTASRVGLATLCLAVGAVIGFWGKTVLAPRLSGGTAVADPAGTPRTKIPGRWNAAGSPNTGQEREQLQALGYLAGKFPAPAETGVTIHDPDRCAPGFNFYCSGHAPEAILTDMDGRVLHRWRCEFRTVWPDYQVDERNPSPHCWRRAFLLPDGDVLAIFEGLGLIRVDRESNLLWSYKGPCHHDLFVNNNGDLTLLLRQTHLIPRRHPKYPIVEDFIAVFDSAGQPRSRLSLLEAFENSSYAPLLEHTGPFGDIFHTNTVEVLDGRLQEILPAFARGNILVSVREMDTIAVVDPEQGRVVWAMTGAWARQHQPTVLDNGNILLFDNKGHLGRSKVIEFDPATRRTAWSYEGTAENGFYSETCGTAQRLPNGNTLVTQSDSGRAFEVTPENEIVWEFVSPHRAGESDELIATLFELQRLPPDQPLEWLPLR